VPGVDGRKMSKSYDNCVYLSDTPEEMERKIKTMITDPQRVRRTDAGDPEKCPVFELHKIFSTQEERDEVTEGCRTAGIGCIDCKMILIKNLLTVLEPIWEKRKELLDKPEYVKEVVSAGREKAKKVSDETMADVRKAIKFDSL
jgi:tryptophanyl-tRNA synthetase